MPIKDKLQFIFLDLQRNTLPGPKQIPSDQLMWFHQILKFFCLPTTHKNLFKKKS